jgi:phi13 family phage major tail protein
MGFDSLYMAEVLTDNETDGLTYGTPEILAPAGEISKSTKLDSQVKYYDNVPFLVANAEGNDEIKLSVPALPVATIAKITGKATDTTTGILLDDGVTKTKYFAIGYRLLMSDGTYRLVWRNKGTFQMGDEKAKSASDKADSNGIELSYTGICTVSKLTYPDASEKPAKNVVCDERDNKVDMSKRFAQVVTPENLIAVKKI